MLMSEIDEAIEEGELTSSKDYILTKMLNSELNDGKDIELIVDIPIPSELSDKVDNSINSIRKITAFDREIYHVDGNHTLSTEQRRIKLKSQITPKVLNNILETFIECKLISPDEKTNFLKAYDNYIKGFLDQLVSQLKFQQYKDLTVIINYIKNCKSNDLLVNLHQYLLSDKFNYLREYSLISFWQGTNKDGRITSTSKSWAMIEKSIELQMIHNLKTKSKFKQKLTDERSKQFDKEHLFFGINRNFSKLRTHNASFEYFREANFKLLDEKYRTHFATYNL